MSDKTVIETETVHVGAHGWVWPTNMKANQHILTDTYMRQRSPTYKHEGVDLRAWPGFQIIAPVDGLVAFAHLWDGTLRRWNNYGNFVIVVPDEVEEEVGPIAVYLCHMKTLRVVTGQRVVQGQVLGDAGATGNTGNPPAAHLHLHICADGGVSAVFGQRVIDPTPYLV